MNPNIFYFIFQRWQERRGCVSVGVRVKCTPLRGQGHVTWAAGERDAESSPSLSIVNFRSARCGKKMRNLKTKCLPRMCMCFHPCSFCAANV